MSVKAMKTAFPLLRQKLMCSKIAFYKNLFLTSDLPMHLLMIGIENGWTSKKTLSRETPFMRSRLPSVPLALMDITNFEGAYRPFKAQELVQLINIVLGKRSKLDYLDVLAFGNDRSLWHSIQRFEFDWCLRSIERREKLQMINRDHTKSLLDRMKEGVIEKWEKNKAKERKWL